MIKLRVLEEQLQTLDGFNEPKIEYEQYITSGHIAACMLHTAESHFGDISGKLICDLGTGCATLAIGAALLNASYCIGFEIDLDALKIAKENINEMEVTDQIDLIQCNIETGIDEKWYGLFDTVIMNPPFGTKTNKGIDMNFLKIALQLTNNAVYSLHKTSTRAHILRKAKQWGVDVKIIAQLRYDLPETYAFHKKSSVDIHVDFIRFTIPKNKKINF